MTASRILGGSMKLLRRRDVMERLGVSTKQLTKLVEAGLVRALRKSGARAWYLIPDLDKI